MKFIFILVILILVQNCSFDKKSGIWKMTFKFISKKSSHKLFEEFEDLNSEQEIFDKIIQSNREIKLYSNPEMIIIEINDHSLNKLNTLNLTCDG